MTMDNFKVTLKALSPSGGTILDSLSLCLSFLYSHNGNIYGISTQLKVEKFTGKKFNCSAEK